MGITLTTSQGVVVLSMKKPTQYIEDGKIITIKEWAKGMKNVLYVVLEEDGSEGLRSVDQLKQLEMVREEPVVPRVKRQRRARKGERLTEYAGHLAAGTDPVTAAVVSDVFNEPRRKTPKIEIRQFGVDEQVSLGEMLVGLVGAALLVWSLATFAI